jgi:hypothetical protein
MSLVRSKEAREIQYSRPYRGEAHGNSVESLLQSQVPEQKRSYGWAHENFDASGPDMTSLFVEFWTGKGHQQGGW